MTIPFLKKSTKPPRPQVRIAFRTPLRVSFLLRVLRGRRFDALPRDRSERPLL